MMAVLSKTAEIGRVKNTVTSPRAISMARRRFSSISGPSTKPSSKGAGSKSCLTNQYPPDLLEGAASRPVGNPPAAVDFEAVCPRSAPNRGDTGLARKNRWRRACRAAAA